MLSLFLCLKINCAGTSIAFEFDDESYPSSEFDRMLRVNTLGSIYPTRSVLQAGGLKDQALKNGGGRIVFVSSQIAQCAIHGYSAYAASKWAIRGIAEALQMELKPWNILVSVSYPPDTDTPGYEIEMQTKPEITKLISESGNVFSPIQVAKDIINYSEVYVFFLKNFVSSFITHIRYFSYFSPYLIRLVILGSVQV